MNRAPLAVTPAGIIGTLLLAAIVLVFLKLGFWQLARLAEQREVNVGIAARLDAPAIAEPAALLDTTGLYYRVVAARGTYDNDRSIVLPGRSRRGLPGVYLLTPLRLAGRTDAVLVNRGWVPSADAATIEVSDFAVTDTVAMSGLVLPFPGRSESLSLRDTAAAPSFRRVWYTVDETALRAQFPYRLLPATLQLVPPAAEAGGIAPAGIDRYPTPLDPPPLDQGPHLGYALQWFSFALVGIIGWIALMMRARGPARATPPVMALLLFGISAAPASAQLRPLEGMEWRVVDDGVLFGASVVGRQDGHSWVVHGNEDMRELRVGFDIGTRRWLSARYIRGLSEFSPEHGLRLGAGVTIAR